jgi:hypothetical protein
MPYDIQHTTWYLYIVYKILVYKILYYVVHRTSYAYYWYTKIKIYPPTTLTLVYRTTYLNQAGLYPVWRSTSYPVCMQYAISGGFPGSPSFRACSPPGLHLYAKDPRYIPILQRRPLCSMQYADHKRSQ